MSCDWGLACRVELDRLGVRLANRVVRVGGVDFTPTDRLVALSLGKIAPRGGGCWWWTGFVDRDGYGQINAKVNGKSTTMRAHRFVYMLLKDRVPDGMTLDHLCRVRPCVNPEHLDPCLQPENVSRSPLSQAAKTHCPRGHPYDRSTPRQRRCSTCDREHGELRRDKARRGPYRLRNEKRCPGCGNTKALTDFHRDVTSADGVYGWCRPCKNEGDLARRLKKRQGVANEPRLA